MQDLYFLLAPTGTDVSVLEQLTAFALLGLPAGLLGGMLLGLVAAKREALGGYGSLRRRALRLGHVATIMLPLIAGFYSLAGATWGVNEQVLRWAGPLWIGGACSLVLVLFTTALKPRARYLLPVPASALCAAAVLFAIALKSAVA